MDHTFVMATQTNSRYHQASGPETLPLPTPPPLALGSHVVDLCHQLSCFAKHKAGKKFKCWMQTDCFTALMLESTVDFYDPPSRTNSNRPEDVVVTALGFQQGWLHDIEGAKEGFQQVKAAFSEYLACFSPVDEIS